MDRGLFTLQKAPAVAGGIDRKWRKEGKKEKKGRERVWGVLLISPLHSLFYNELQLWLQIKTELFFFFLSFFSGDYLQSGARVEVRSQQSRGRKDTAREGEKRRRRETGGGGGGRGEEGKQRKREDEVQIRGQWKMER